MELYRVAHHVHGLWDVAEEVHDPPRLLDVALWVGLQSVDHVGKLHAVTDEEAAQRKQYSEMAPHH